MGAMMDDLSFGEYSHFHPGITCINYQIHKTHCKLCAAKVWILLARSPGLP
jgi:hypothetical protein